METIRIECESSLAVKRPKGLSRWKGMETIFQVSPDRLRLCPKGLSRWKGMETLPSSLLPTVADSPKGLSRWKGMETNSLTRCYVM